MMEHSRKGTMEHPRKGRVIERKRKTWLAEQLRDRILGKEPQEEVTELVTVEDTSHGIEDQVEEPTEADIEHDSGKKKEEEEEDSEEDDEDGENDFTEEEA